MNDSLQYVTYFDSIMAMKSNAISLSSFRGMPVSPKPHIWAYEPVVGIGCLVCIILLAFAISRTNGYLGRTLKELFTGAQRKIDYQTETQDSVLGKGAYWALSILGYTLFIVLNLGGARWTFTAINWQDLVVFAFMAISIVMSLLIKSLSLQMIGYVFDLRRNMQEYRKYIFVLLMLLGQVSLAGCFAQIFLPLAIFDIIKWIMMAVFAIALILSIRKSFQFFYIRPLSAYYLFLYFCTFDLVPFLVLKKACWDFLGLV